MILWRFDNQNDSWAKYHTLKSFYFTIAILQTTPLSPSCVAVSTI